MEKRQIASEPEVVGVCETPRWRINTGWKMNDVGKLIKFTAYEGQEKKTCVIKCWKCPISVSKLQNPADICV